MTKVVGVDDIINLKAIKKLVRVIGIEYKNRLEKEKLYLIYLLKRLGINISYKKENVFYLE